MVSLRVVPRNSAKPDGLLRFCQRGVDNRAGNVVESGAVAKFKAQPKKISAPQSGVASVEDVVVILVVYQDEYAHDTVSVTLSCCEKRDRASKYAKLNRTEKVLAVSLFESLKVGRGVNEALNELTKFHEVFRNMSRSALRRFREEKDSIAAGTPKPAKMQQGAPPIVPHECREAIKKKVRSYSKR